MTPDPDKTRAFYSDLFGWKVDDPGPDHGGYQNFVLGRRPDRRQHGQPAR